MYAPHKLFPERRMNRPVPGDSGLAFENRASDPHVEMAFTAFLKARMTAMAFAVIYHLKLTRLKRACQARSDLFGNTHLN